MAYRYRFYSGAQVLVVLAGVFGAALLYSGWGATVSPSLARTQPRLLAGSLAIGGGVVGWYAFGRLRIGRWHAIGRGARLTPAGSGGLVSRLRTIVTNPVAVSPLPDLTGSVSGRPVRATTYAMSKQGTDSGSRNYTVVEAELDEPTDMSVLLLPATDESEEAVGLLPGELETAAVDDEFMMVGTGAVASAERVLSERNRAALRDMEAPAGVFVGDPTDAMMDALGSEVQMAMGFIGDKLERAIRDHPANDPATVSINNAGLLLNPVELERQAEAVAAVADEVERVRRETDER